ncbi:AfsR/SARP family transcriptional regulator [Catelliglobosispora koreensis]|uniref:AfsR/SARP family transcriptional regulator n=1 Tax=Catelliglobosispora koreensis TaxID=129052 RepID=UPI000361BFF7|nr:BTAD domain-containing putative transcriptional regulator [Catelliglobosispora koreensis]
MRFGILGPIEVSDGEAIIAAGRPRHRALLAFLLLNTGRTVTIDGIAEALWGGIPPATARSQIQAMVCTLREITGRKTIETKQCGYCLHAPDFDLTDFQRHLADAAVAETAIAAKHLRAALDLWRGPALAGCDAPFAEAARVYLEEQRLVAWERLAQKELELGRHEELAVALNPVTTANPLRGKLIELHMLALYRCGRSHEALAIGRRFRAGLADLHGLDPDAGFAGLEQAILRADPSLDRPHQMPSAPTPRQLPLTVSDFTGRAEEAAQLTAYLAQGESLAAITGPPGIGKTALALRWAHEHADAFADGQLFFNLQGTEPVAVLAFFLRSLGVRSLPVDVEEASAAYRSALAGKRILIVLDNAASAEQIRPLLPGGGTCFTLVTSTSRLASLTATDGARRISLPCLPEAEVHELVGRIVGAQRAAREPHAVSGLVRACAGLPLAVRITAAQVADQPSTPIEAFAQRLATDPLSAMTSADDGHIAVRQAFSRSYERLRPAEQKLFRHLGLVPATDFSEPAVAALAGQPVLETTALLHRLAGIHLLEYGGVGRYTFHDLVRAYAHELAADDDSSLNRYYAWYLAHTDAAARALYPHLARLSRPETTVTMTCAEALSWLDTERLNLLALMTHCAQNGPFDVAWLLADDLRGYFALRQYSVCWRTAATAAVRAAQAASNLSVQRHLLAVFTPAAAT